MRPRLEYLQPQLHLRHTPGTIDERQDKRRVPSSSTDLPLGLLYGDTAMNQAIITRLASATLPDPDPRSAPDDGSNREEIALNDCAATNEMDHVIHRAPSEILRMPPWIRIRAWFGVIILSSETYLDRSLQGESRMVKCFTATLDNSLPKPLHLVA